MNLPTEKKDKVNHQCLLSTMHVDFFSWGEGDGRSVSCGIRKGSGISSVGERQCNVVKIIVFRAKGYLECYPLESLVTIDVVE